MFIKLVTKKDKSSGKSYKYYRLCESYRSEGQPKHRTILNLGSLEKLSGRQSRKLLVARIEQLLTEDSELFQLDIDPEVENLAREFHHEILIKEKIDKLQKGDGGRNFKVVDINSVRHEQVREIGAEWLCYQAIDQLGLTRYLAGQGWEEEKVNTAIMHLISRCVYPASEHKTAQWIRENSAVSSLFGIHPEQVNRFQLYKASRDLYSENEKIEVFLSHKTNELFDIQDKIILYDLTNTYFEGGKQGSRIAMYGRSKEKRSDAKLLCMALVTNIEGFVKYHKTLRGNISDTVTLEATVDELSRRSSCTSRKPLVVTDAGIASEDNLKMLKEKGYPYLCVTRSKLKDYEFSKETNGTVRIKDKNEKPIDLAWVEKPGCNDTYLYVRSEGKAKKELSMKAHFTSHYEEGLENIRHGILNKGGIKKLVKVWERIGRLKEKYPSANRFYDIVVESKEGIATQVKWHKKQPKTRSSEGVYFIRTSLPADSEETIWAVYNTIREIEATFRVLKTDLDLRPIFHKSDDHALAHITLGVLAYQVVNTIRHQLKANNIRHDWRNVVRLMNTQKEVTTKMKTNLMETITIKKCSDPIQSVKEIYNALQYKTRPYMKKSVLPENQIRGS